MVIENAFGRLKGRWRCLLKRLDFKLENVPHVVAACVVLHNMCEMFGDHCLEEWTHRDDPQDSHSQSSYTSTTSLNACTVRDAIMQHLSM